MAIDVILLLSFPANSVIMKTQKASKVDSIIFILAIWLFSRLIIVVAMQIITPLVFTTPVHTEWGLGNRPHDFMPGYIPQSSWELFSHWDGKWYRSIVTEGYEYLKDGQQHSIAFFPLFPLLVRAVMVSGLPFEIAGTLVSNLALLGAVSVLYVWMVESDRTYTQARWVAAVLVFCPSSLFGTVIYTESLFLLVTIAALRAFDRHQYGWAAFWGALASATRVFGICLIPAFLFLAWKERRPTIAYVAALAVSSGLLLFCFYSAVSFGDALAFMHTQQGWEHESWLELVKKALTLDQPSLIAGFTVLGCIYVLWHRRTQMPTVAIAYGVCSLALLLVAGRTSGISTSSLPRYLYGIVPFSVGLGLWLARFPRVGYLVMALFAVRLFLDAMHFAAWDFVG